MVQNQSAAMAPRPSQRESVILPLTLFRNGTCDSTRFMGDFIENVFTSSSITFPERRSSKYSCMGGLKVNRFVRFCIATAMHLATINSVPALLGNETKFGLPNSLPGGRFPFSHRYRSAHCTRQPCRR